MNDTVTRLMALADDYADWARAKGQEHPAYLETRQALEAELTRLFTTTHPAPEGFYQGSIADMILKDKK